MDRIGSLSSRRTYNRTRISANNLPAEWIHTEMEVGNRVMLYLHGGGYVFGSITSHRELAFQLAQAARARALVVEYRLAPEHPHPAALEDAVSAYSWLLDHGTEATQITVMGDSAGGGLTIALLQTLRDRHIPLPSCAVCLSPWTDLTSAGGTIQTNRNRDPLLTPEALHDWAAYYAGGMDLKSPSISPLYGDLSGLPPTLVQVGNDEILRDDSRRLTEWAQKAGSPFVLEVWPKVFHVWHFGFPIIPEARRAMQSIGRFVEQSMQTMGNQRGNQGSR